uniref:Hydroxyproline-rich glycoprotein family protein n=1 Tax=Rhizophora mucronata TaxID=61149 RepID=A0A2P2K8X7_RHIMU
MRSVNNTLETINAAASAIVSAESRVQPPAVPKRRRGGCWSLYWCFGSHKTSKRVDHAAIVSETEVPGTVIPAVIENQTRPISIVLPLIAPPSSPASLLQSDPPSSTQSPGGLVPLTSLSVNCFSPGGPASIFAAGPYAHETQLVTPPAFSAFTTEPSTASFTPPPEPVQLTTPSSPEVPFAQLLTSSLERSGTKQKLALAHSEFQSYQLYPGSPGGQLISPASALSNSGTSSPLPDRHPILEIRMGEAPKLLRFEHFTTHKWGSRLGSGSVTPDGTGLGSRLCSGSLTPDGVGLGSRLGTGSVTPDGVGLRSRLGSGCMTPDCGGPLENPISEVASPAKSNNVVKIEDQTVDHRVSFELSGEEVARCLENKSVASNRSFLEYPQNMEAEKPTESESTNSRNCLHIVESSSETSEKPSEETEEEHCHRKHRSITLGSIKEFNFDNSKGEVPEKRTISSEWWANEATGGKEAKPESYWTFFPMLQPEVS